MQTTEKCLVWKRPRITHCLECSILKHCSQGKNKIKDRMTFLESLERKARVSDSENKASHLKHIGNEIKKLEVLIA